MGNEQGSFELSTLIGSFGKGQGHMTRPKTKGTKAMPANVILNLASVLSTS